MIYLRLMLTLLLPLLLGLGAVALICRKAAISFLERIALAWGIGLGLLGMSMFTLSLLGIRLTLISASLPALFGGAVLFIFAAIRKYPLLGLNSALDKLKAFAGIFIQPNRPKAVAEKLLALLIILVMAFVFFDALLKPIINFDDLWRQGSIAKIIYTTGRVIIPYTQELAGAHPYLNPLSQAWIYFGINAWNDAWGKIVFALCFTSLIFVFYAGVRKYADRFTSLLFTYLLTSFPLIIYHAGTAYSDFMQTFYYSVAAIYLFRWINNRQNRYIYVSALCFGIGNFVKQAGIPLWGAAAIVLFAYLLTEQKDKIRSGLVFLLITFIISSPWLFNPGSFMMNRISSLAIKNTITSAEIAPQINSAYGKPSLNNILYYLGKRMFTYADWQMLWFVFFLAIIFNPRRIWRTDLKYLLGIILADLALMIYAFSDAGTYQFLADGTLVNRTLMLLAPLTLFFIAIAVSDHKKH